MAPPGRGGDASPQMYSLSVSLKHAGRKQIVSTCQPVVAASVPRHPALSQRWGTHKITVEHASKHSHYPVHEIMKHSPRSGHVQVPDVLGPAVPKLEIELLIKLLGTVGRHP